MLEILPDVFRSRYALVAGAVGGAVALTDTLLGPFLGPVADLGAAAATAWIGARSVSKLAAENGVCEKEALRRVAEATRSSHGRHLAHKTLHFACKATAKEAEVVRAAGAVAVHCVRTQATSLVTHVLVGWAPPLFGSAKVIAASRAAYDAATFVHAMESAFTLPVAAAA